MMSHTLTPHSTSLNIIDCRYDSDDNPIIKKKAIEPLPPLDHSKIHYEPFEKNFYEEHEEIAKMSHDEIIEYRKALGTSPHLTSPHLTSLYKHTRYSVSIFYSSHYSILSPSLFCVMRHTLCF